jgi:hypothetical protein
LDIRSRNSVDFYDATPLPRRRSRYATNAVNGHKNRLPDWPKHFTANSLLNTASCRDDHDKFPETHPYSGSAINRPNVAADC